MHTPYGSLALAFPLVAAALVPADADACPYYMDPCSYAEGWIDLAPRNADKIPTDGVLVLQGNFANVGSLDDIDLEVTKDGQPIAGALETTVQAGVLVWRPTAPWEAGATYQLAGVITNQLPVDGCTPPEIPLAADILIDTVAGAPLVAAEFDGVTTLQQAATLSLETIACCEDATPPTQGFGGCGGYYLNFDPLECAPTAATGFFSLTIDGTPAADGPAARQIVYTLKIDGAPASSSLDPGAQFTSLFAPVCISFDATDLASGAVTSSDEQCFGEDFVDELGPQPLDPAETLACTLEMCALSMDGMSWDTTMCHPFVPDPDTDSGTDSTSADTSSGSGDADSASSELPTSDADSTPTTDADSASSGASDTTEQDGEKGCACATTAAPPPAALLALSALLALPRRRRRAGPA
jgi:MYXO-CTERM domain-containing protein